MKAEDIYKKESGEKAYNEGMVGMSPKIEYIEWLEKMVEKRYEPTILKWIKKMFLHAEEKEWDRVYFTFDFHGTIAKADYRKSVKDVVYYPYAKETLQLLSNRQDIKTILWTSSYPDELEIYKKYFKKDNIKFDFIGENPDINNEKGSFGYYKDKHYFNVLADDKCGFEPERDWKFLYDYFSDQEYRPKTSWNMKYKEDYHKN